MKGSLLATQAFLRTKAATDAILINLSSAIAHIPPMAGFSGYAASKLAATKFFDYVQAENPTLHVVNVQPGIVETSMNIKSEIPALDNGMRSDCGHLNGVLMDYCREFTGCFLGLALEP